VRSKKPDKPIAYQTFSVCHDAVDQFLNGRNVVDQAYDHSTAPGARIHITVNHNFWISNEASGSSRLAPKRFTAV
jgi:hypothetical protein